MVLAVSQDVCAEQTTVSVSVFQFLLISAVFIDSLISKKRNLKVERYEAEEKERH